MMKTIFEINKQIQRGLRPSELLKLCKDRALLTKELNCYVRIIDGSEASGELHGIPVAIKDNFCTKGIRTSCASRMLESFTPTYDATVVKRLKDSGAVIIGKTNLDEFAMGSGTVDSIYGPTINIWGSKFKYTIGGKARKEKPLPRIAGGSSGGSAVAVASGSCFAALGSDSGGSTRNPASFCGVVGYKPTYSTVSRHGLIPLVNSMDVPGIITRSVDDSATIYNVISGYDEYDSTSVPSKKVNINNVNVTSLKVGIPKEYYCKGISSSVLETWKSIAQLLQKNNISVIPVSLPHTQYSIVCYSVLNQCEVASNMAKYDGLRYGHRADTNISTNELYAKTRKEGFNHVVRGRILAGNYFLLQKNYEKYFEKALKVRRLIKEDFSKVWQNVDLLLTPTTLTEAPTVNDFKALNNREQCAIHDYCTQPANMAGCPAISIPVNLSCNEMPLSVQLMAPNYNDEVLLAMAKFIESQVRFPKLELVT